MQSVLVQKAACFSNKAQRYPTVFWKLAVSYRHLKYRNTAHHYRARPGREIDAPRSKYTLE